jgi:uncharacterized membrane protein
MPVVVANGGRSDAEGGVGNGKPESMMVVIMMIAAVATLFRMAAFAPIPAIAPEKTPGGSKQYGGAKQNKDNFHRPNFIPA